MYSLHVLLFLAVCCYRLNTKTRYICLSLSGIELYSRWVPLIICRHCLRIIDLIMDRQSYSDVSTKGPCLDEMFFNYLQSIAMQKQMTVIGERLFD